MNRRMLIAAVAASLVVSGSSAQEFAPPDNYPADYGALVDAAKAESPLLIYSNVSAANWRPFLDLAKERFPWMTVETTDDNSPFEKYMAESGSGVRTADIMLATSPGRWVEFVASGEVMPYDTPEKPALPDWAYAAGDGVYAASADPFIITYNRRAFPIAPTSIKEVLQSFLDNPDQRGKVGTYSPETETGIAVWKTWFAANPDNAATLEGLGPFLRPETSAGTMREKVVTGEYAAAILTSGAGIRLLEEPALKAVAGWSYIQDGTPAMVRSVAITRVAQSPSSAKLILDLLLSRDGQIAFAQGGQTPYRSDIAPDDVPYSSYAAMVSAVGEEHIIPILPNPALNDGREAFIAVWEKALGR
jgi:iron(III) transport system substrate-binding protein